MANTILTTADVKWELNLSCSCKLRHYADMYDTKDGYARTGLFNLIHHLLHTSRFK